MAYKWGLLLLTKWDDPPSIVWGGVQEHEMCTQRYDTWFSTGNCHHFNIFAACRTAWNLLVLGSSMSQKLRQSLSSAYVSLSFPLCILARKLFVVPGILDVGHGRIKSTGLFNQAQIIRLVWFHISFPISPRTHVMAIVNLPPPNVPPPQK